MENFTIKDLLGFDCESRITSEKNNNTIHISKNYGIFDELYYNLENVNV